MIPAEGLRSARAELRPRASRGVLESRENLSVFGRGPTFVMNIVFDDSHVLRGVRLEQRN